MDAFYASVELLDNPSLKDKPFAVRIVAHETIRSSKCLQVGHGVISTASYEARKYGVRSGMAGAYPVLKIITSFTFFISGFIAKKLCPELILIDHNFEKYLHPFLTYTVFDTPWLRYSEMSNRVMDIFAQYDPNMCPAGCDEGYLK